MGKTSLHAAADVGYLDIAKLLLDAGADTKRANAKGNTPLLTAALRNRTDLIKLLVEAGSDPNAQGVYG